MAKAEIPSEGDKFRRAAVRRLQAKHCIPSRFGGMRGRWCVKLKIDHQQFTIGADYITSERHATWTARQLAIALYRFKYGPA